MTAKGKRLLLGLAVCALLGPAAPSAADRLAGPLLAARPQRLPGSRHPLATPARARERVAAGMRLEGVALHFRPSAAQQAELEALLARQQDPASPDYHRWLSPEEYGARFGLSDADLEAVTAWLAAQGLEVQEVARGRNRIAFGGTVARLEAAFAIELRQFDVEGERHFAPAGELSVPAPLAGLLSGVRNLDDFRPRRRSQSRQVPAPLFTSSATQHFLTPNDVATIYDVSPLYAQGYDGGGQTIAVIGQSDLALSDVAAFRAAAGLAPLAPSKVQVPSSGTPTVKSGDVDEAALDVEWSGAMAPAAQVVYVFTGDASNKNAWDSLVYIIDQDLAPVVSVSYGVCEAVAGSDAQTLLLELQRAQTQGQTVISASGDSGAAGCDSGAAPATHGYDTDLPASYPEVTGVGGTTLSGDLASPATYWRASNDVGGGSAKGYIPETAWNDTGSSLSASGGGASGLYPKPAWQAGAGVPADGQRDVPDIALAASAQHDGYLYCVSGGCTSGFASNGYVHIIGGTSAGAPVFAGMAAVLVQATGGARLGLLNPTLYALAASVPSAFHPVTAGDNIVPCGSGTTDCPSSLELGYAATAGYDQVTGLGSVDAFLLVSAWPGNTLGRAPTVTALGASPRSAKVGAAITLSATVSAAGTMVPDGATVQFSADGAALGSAVALAGGQATLAVTTLTAGAHAVTAAYSGDSQYAPSVSSAVSVAVGSGSSGGGGCASGGGGGLVALGALAALALAVRRRRA